MKLVFDNGGSLIRLTSMDGRFNISFDECSFTNVQIIGFLSDIDIFKKKPYGNELREIYYDEIMRDIMRYTDNSRRGFDGYEFNTIKKIDDGFGSSLGASISVPANGGALRFKCETHLSVNGVEGSRSFMIKDRWNRLIVGVTISKKDIEYKKIANRVLEKLGFAFSVNEMLW